jgi:membrane protein YqaA with SNARE-associated domain
VSRPGGDFLPGDGQQPMKNIIKRLTDALRTMKEWVEGFAGKPSADHALFWIAFVESSFFPIPPDVLLIAMSIGKPRRSFRNALLCTAGSVCGAFLGYFIGYALFETVGRPILEFYGALDKFEIVLQNYRENGILALFIAGFTPIPFKLFTIAAGFNQTLDLTTLAIGSVIGRSSRFFLVGGLLYLFGESMKTFLDKYFDKLSVAFVILLVLGFVVVRWLL